MSFFSHRAHRFNRTHLRTVSSPQNASGIQISQSVKTIVDTNKGQHEAYIHSIGVSRWSLPFPPGEGLGEGPLSHRTPPAYRKHRTLLLNFAMRFRKEQLSYDDKKMLHCFKRAPSKYEYNVSSDCIYNLHEIRMLWMTFENMPFLLQEGRLQRARGACSRM